MKIVYGVLLSFITFSIHADECSNLVDGYLKGLRAGAMLTTGNKSEIEIAQKQIDHITKVREYKDDCFIVETIPELKLSKDAVEHAAQSSKSK